MIHWWPYTDFHDLNIDWILATLKKLVDEVNQIDTWIENNQDQYNSLIETVNTLEKELTDIQNGNFPPEMIQAIGVWLRNNIGSILATIVWFGVSQDGYFVAYIPDAWKDILFVTPMDFTKDDYGSLCLYYDIDEVIKELS